MSTPSQRKFKLLTKEERQSHIDLNTPCDLRRPVKYSGKVVKTSGKHKSVKYFNKGREALEKLLGIQKPRGWHTCHLCPNCSTSKDYICANPRHLYFGTPTENMNDIYYPQEMRITKESLKQMGTTNQVKNPNCVIPIDPPKPIRVPGGRLMKFKIPNNPKPVRPPVGGPF